MSILATEIIRKTQQKQELSFEEITEFIRLYSKDKIPDYQMSAWLMAAYLNGLTKKETSDLAIAIKESGRSLNWKELGLDTEKAKIADKHSTGGVGDKVSLIVVPLAIHLGLKIPMMSGRSLGHTGGTVDKLESIPGFSMYPSEEAMLQQMRELGAVMMAQSDELCPADKRLYALRDVTSTVDSIPLITASIVSKKWAEGVGSIVYDVKAGCGAFMKELKDARKLARSLVDVSTQVGMTASAMITRMDEPLGAMIGNSVEVLESMWILANEYPDEDTKRICAPLAQLCCEMAAEMAYLAGTVESLEEGVEKSKHYLESGGGAELFKNMCLQQGALEDSLTTLARAKIAHSIESEKDGFVDEIDSLKIGLCGLELGIGRKTKEDQIDPKLGFRMRVKPGDQVKIGQTLIEVFAETDAQIEHAQSLLKGVIKYSSREGVAKGPLLMETLRS